MQMSQTSLDKSKIKFLLLEGVHQNAVDTLKAAGREVGGVQIQNRGTIAGNICNASPAADGVPALIALDAEVEVSGQGGIRRLAVAEFIQGNRRTALQDGELVTAIYVPRRSSRALSSFLKLGARRYLIISIAMVAVVVDIDKSGAINHAGVAIGSCSFMCFPEGF